MGKYGNILGILTRDKQIKNVFCGHLRRADRRLYYGFEHYIEPSRKVDVLYLALTKERSKTKSLRQLI